MSNRLIIEKHISNCSVSESDAAKFRLKAVFSALVVSLSDFFNTDDDVSVNPLLLTAVKNLTEEQQLRLADFINTFI